MKDSHPQGDLSPAVPRVRNDRVDAAERSFTSLHSVQDDIRLQLLRHENEASRCHPEGACDGRISRCATRDSFTSLHSVQNDSRLQLLRQRMKHPRKCHPELRWKDLSLCHGDSSPRSTRFRMTAVSSFCGMRMKLILVACTQECHPEGACDGRISRCATKDPSPRSTRFRMTAVSSFCGMRYLTSSRSLHPRCHPEGACDGRISRCAARDPSPAPLGSG